MTRPGWPDVRTFAQSVVGCAVLGLGVAMLLGPALGSDGYSTLVNGLAIATDWSFMAANVVVSVSFVGMAWLRGVRPGIGTLVQILVVGAVVTAALPWLDPQDLAARLALLAVAFPVLATGIAVYLDAGLGAGPVEAAALAWDPPLPFAWSYSLVQGTGALAGWQLGAAIGPGTVLVIVLLGPAVALVGRVLRLRLEQPGGRGDDERRPSPLG